VPKVSGRRRGGGGGGGGKEVFVGEWLAWWHEGGGGGGGRAECGGVWMARWRRGGGGVGVGRGGGLEVSEKWRGITHTTILRQPSKHRWSDVVHPENL